MESGPLEDFASRVRGVQRTRELDSAAAEALRAFALADVASLLLKGAALSRFLYTADQQRGYSDVDLLVAPNDLEQARDILSELGYTNLTGASGVEDIADAVHADTWVRRNQQIGPLMIDLHARLPGVGVTPDVAWRLLASRRVAIELNGQRAWVMALEGLALHVAAHAAQHGPEHPRPLADLRHALEHWPPAVWHEARALAEALDAVPAFAAGLRLVPAGARLASELELPPTDDLEWEMRHRAVRPRGTFHLQAFLDAKGIHARLGVIRRALLPKREWIVWEDPRAARGGLPLVRARVRHAMRVPVWALRALLYRVRRARGARISRP